jgi:hypothetical protein
VSLAFALHPPVAGGLCSALSSWLRNSSHVRILCVFQTQARWGGGAAGDCDNVTQNAGADAGSACKRDNCTNFREYSECIGVCFKASCDWNTERCAHEKSVIAQCPAYDAAVYASVQRAQIRYHQGGSAEGYGRCDAAGCQVPTTAETNLSWTAGAFGRGISVGQAGPWLLSVEGALPASATEMTVEAWVRMDPPRDGLYFGAATQTGYIVSWEAMSLVVLPWAGRGFAFGLEFGERRNGTGVASAPWSVCASDALLTAPRGLVTDGPGPYTSLKDCSWTIAPDASQGAPETRWG